MEGLCKTKKTIMKKAYSLFFLMLLATATAFAQVQIGLRAGANFSTISEGVEAANNADELWRPGLVVGLASSFQVGETFALAPEINYSQRGRRIEGTNNVDIRYNYLEVPVLARLAFGDVLKGYINAGPSFSYLLGGNRDMDGTSMDYNVNDAGYKRFELGGAIGGGVQLDTEVGSFLIDLRYTAGFSNFRENVVVADEPYLSGDPGKYKNQLITTSLIFLIPSVR